MTQAVVNTPQAKVVCGRAKADSPADYDMNIAFLAGSPCAYAEINPYKENPCEASFTLRDGITYTWHGCGGDTWMTWGRGVELGKCNYMPLSTRCNQYWVNASFICG